MVKFNWRIPDAPVNPAVTTIEIVSSGEGNEQADFFAAQQLLAQHSGRINQFIEQRRRAGSLGDIQLASAKNPHPDLDIRYTNQFGAERVFLRVYPRPPGGGEKDFLTLASPCLMVLYGDDQIAAIPMNQLKNPTKVSVVHKGKVKASFGTDLLLTAQYKFTVKGPSVVLCPINVSTKRVLTVEDTFYLSTVGGHSAAATGPDAVLLQVELDATGGRAFVAPVKTSLPRVGHSTIGVKYDKPNPRLPIINGSIDGATIYTPLDVYALDSKTSKFQRTGSGGDSNSLPYTIGQDGTYYYWPQWGPAFPQTSVMLNLGYAYYEPINTSRNRVLGQTSLVPIANYPQSSGGAPTTDFTYDTPAALADTYTASTQTKGTLTHKLIDLARTTASVTTLTPVGYIDNLGSFDIFGDGNIQTIGFTSTSPFLPHPPVPVTAAVEATSLLGFGYYSSSTPGGNAQAAGIVTAGFGNALDAIDGTVASIAAGTSSFSGQLPYPFYAARSKADTLAATLTPVAASDGDINQLVKLYVGPDGVETTTFPHPDTLTVSSFHFVLPRDGPALGIPPDGFPVGSLITEDGTSPPSIAINYVDFSGPHGFSITLDALYAAGVRQVNDSKLKHGTQFIQFLSGTVSGSSDQTLQTRTNFMYLEPFPPSLDTNHAYYSIEHGDIAGYPAGQGTDVPPANSNLEIATPYGGFAGTKFQPWLHVSNGKHFIQGFQIDDQSHLYCDSVDITSSLPKALTGKTGTPVAINDIKTVIMDVPLGVIKKLR